jgi:hypothetical protein
MGILGAVNALPLSCQGVFLTIADLAEFYTHFAGCKCGARLP